MEAVFGTRGVFARSCGTTRNVDTARQFSKTAQSCQDAVNQEKAFVHYESRVARNANRTYKRHMYASRAEFLRCLAAFTAIFKEDMQRRITNSALGSRERNTLSSTHSFLPASTNTVWIVTTRICRKSVCAANVCLRKTRFSYVFLCAIKDQSQGGGTCLGHTKNWKPVKDSY